MSDACNHAITQGRKGERGGWCVACGVKVFDVDERPCLECAHFQRILTGTVCNKHLMSVMPDMHVTFKIAKGSCWQARERKPS